MLQNKYLKRQIISDFIKNSYLLDAYLDQKIINNFLKAWIQLKTVTNMNQSYSMHKLYKINPSSRSNILIYSKQSDHSDSQNRGRTIRFLTAEDDYVDQREGLPTPKYNFDHIDFSEKSNTLNNSADIQEKSRFEDTQNMEQFEDAILDRLSQLENNLELMKDIRSKSSNSRCHKLEAMETRVYFNHKVDEKNKYTGQKLSLNSKYIKIPTNRISQHRSFVKQEGQYSIINDFSQLKTLQPQYCLTENRHEIPTLKFVKHFTVGKNYGQKSEISSDKDNDFSDKNMKQEGINNRHERTFLHSTIVNSRHKNWQNSQSVRSSQTQDKNWGHFSRKSKNNMNYIKKMKQQMKNKNNGSVIQGNMAKVCPKPKTYTQKLKKNGVFISQQQLQHKQAQKQQILTPSYRTVREHGMCQASIFMNMGMSACYGLMPVQLCHYLPNQQPVGRTQQHVNSIHPECYYQ